MKAPGVVSVRPLRPGDLEGAARFCEKAREVDPLIEPFGQRLSALALGQRARLALWRVAVAGDGSIQGIAFAALREEPVVDFYVAVHPRWRRNGLGRALSEAALASGAVLRARVRDDSAEGPGFLRALDFRQAGAQLSLRWAGRALPEAALAPALSIRRGERGDLAALEQLSAEAWTGAPESFAARAGELGDLFEDKDRLLLLARWAGKPVGYLSAVELGSGLGIEEVAVLPEHRRAGIGRALVAHGLRGRERAALSVAESNLPARALYTLLGFAQAARQLVFEKGRR